MAYAVATDLTENAFRFDPGLFPQAEEEDLPTTIQGKRVGSKNEARVCLALDFFKIPYIYQYTFNGGSRVRGGQVIDILAKTVPLWTPIYIMGAYWHGETKKYEDTIKIREFTKATRGYFRDPVIFEEAETMTIDQAKGTVRSKLR